MFPKIRIGHCRIQHWGTGGWLPIHSVGETLRFKYQTSRLGTNGETPRYIGWDNLLWQLVPVVWKGAKSLKCNADAWCVTAELTNSGIGISEMCPVLISRDWPRRLWLFRTDFACHGRSNQLVGGNVMSLLTGCEQAKCCSWVWSQSWPHRVQLNNFDVVQGEFLWFTIAFRDINTAFLTQPASI